MRIAHLLTILLLTLNAATATAAPAATLNRTGLTSTFADEFDSFRWDETTPPGKKGSNPWRTNYAYSWLKPDDIDHRTLASNKEEQLYVDRNFRGTGSKPLGLDPFSVKNGILTISATRAPKLPELSGFNYLSGVITTKWNFAQQYGVFEMRAKLPQGKGLWPAFWLLPKDGAWPPEIDIMEVIGHETDTLYTTLHSKVDDKHIKSDIPAHKVADMAAGFHTYAVDWGPKEIIFYFDDREIARRPTAHDMHKPFYIVANLAVGGVWPGSPDAATHFPAQYEIDWIRVWQRTEYMRPASIK